MGLGRTFHLAGSEMVEPPPPRSRTESPTPGGGSDSPGGPRPGWAGVGVHPEELRGRAAAAAVRQLPRLPGQQPLPPPGPGTGGGGRPGGICHEQSKSMEQNGKSRLFKLSSAWHFGGSRKKRMPRKPQTSTPGPQSHRGNFWHFLENSGAGLKFATLNPPSKPFSFLVVYKNSWSCYGTILGLTSPRVSEPDPLTHHPVCKSGSSKENRSLETTR